MNNDRAFRPLNIAVLTVSDTRTEANDHSGDTLVERLQQAGHTLYLKVIVPDDIYQIRAVVSGWIANPEVNAILTTGGTGVTGRDGTPEAIKPLLDKELDDFLPRHQNVNHTVAGAGGRCQRHLFILYARFDQRLSHGVG
jgi:molybdenum cofactor biosynthesis protein B